MYYSNLLNHSKKNLIFFLPNFKIGGAGNSIYKICRNIDFTNYNIFIISLGKNEFKDKLKKYNAKIIELPKKRLIFSINLLKKTIINISVNKRTILISNINYANVVCCIFFKKIKNLKIITIERTPIQELDFYHSLNELIKKKIIKFLIKRTYKHANMRIGNSRPVSVDLSKLCGCGVKTYLPYINITKQRINSFSKPTINISWIGRNSPEKNLDDFINATHFLKSKKIFFNIITNKSISDKLKKLNNSTIKNVKYYKFKNINLTNIYKKTDILISTSFYEGFPNVIAEAINYNCLIISSKNFGGTNQLIGKSQGLFYKINDPKDLAKKIHYSIDNPDKMKKIIQRSKKKLIHLSKKYNKSYQNLFLKI